MDAFYQHRSYGLCILHVIGEELPYRTVRKIIQLAICSTRKNLHLSYYISLSGRRGGGAISQIGGPWRSIPGNGPSNKKAEYDRGNEQRVQREYEMIYILQKILRISVKNQVNSKNMSPSKVIWKWEVQRFTIPAQQGAFAVHGGVGQTTIYTLTTTLWEG